MNRTEAYKALCKGEKVHTKESSIYYYEMDLPLPGKVRRYCQVGSFKQEVEMKPMSDTTYQIKGG